MQEDKEMTQIFKTLDLTAFVELAAIILLCSMLIFAIQRILPWAANRLHGKKRLHLLATVPLIRLVIIITAFMLIVPLLIDPSMQNMVALLGTVGLAIGFALKDYASSLIAGVVAIGEKPYRNGDWIQVNGIYGEVRHVGMRTVEIVTPDDTVVAIPHACLWKDAIFNANDGSPRLQCVADFYLHPEHDSAQARQIFLDVVLTSPYLHFREPIAVIVTEKLWATHYRVKAYPIDSSQQFRFVSDLTVRGKAALQAQEIRCANVPIAPAESMAG